MTSIVILRDDVEERECRIAIGSADGQLFLGSAGLCPSGTPALAVDSQFLIPDGDSMVYALACETTNTASTGSTRLWIGHALGLAFIDLQHA